VQVEDSEAETEVSGAGPSGPSTLREEDKQIELLMGLKESFDWTNELLVELKESIAGFVNTDVDSTLKE